MTKKLWFKAKTYGWGWTPCSWEGWLLVLLYVGAFALYLIKTLDAQLNGSFGAPIWYHVSIVLLTLGIIFISYKKGEKPSWRWPRSEERRRSP
jgi:uncharacterized membrane protein YhdT